MDNKYVAYGVIGLVVLIVIYVFTRGSNPSATAKPDVLTLGPDPNTLAANNAQNLSMAQQGFASLVNFQLAEDSLGSQERIAATNADAAVKEAASSGALQLQLAQLGAGTQNNQANLAYQAQLAQIQAAIAAAQQQQKSQQNASLINLISSGLGIFGNIFGGGYGGGGYGGIDIGWPF